MDGPSPWLHRSWQTDEGLPDNSVTGLAQTNDGYMWVATRGGLLRFNGSAFTDIPLPAMEGISNRVVRSVYLDRRDRLWLGMERGRVICLERGNVRIYGPGDGLPEQIIRSMVDDARGNLWLTFPTGLARISAGECRVFGPEDGLTRTRGNTRVVVQANGEVAYMHGGQLRVLPGRRFATGAQADE